MEAKIMENIGEKVAYLKGLAEGLKVDASTNEGKMIIAAVENTGKPAIKRPSGVDIVCPGRQKKKTWKKLKNTGHFS